MWALLLSSPAMRGRLWKIWNCEGGFDKDTAKERCPRNRIWAQIQMGHLCSSLNSVCREGKASCIVWSWTFPEIKMAQYSVLALGARYQTTTTKPSRFSLRWTIALDDKIFKLFKIPPPFLGTGSPSHLELWQLEFFCSIVFSPFSYSISMLPFTRETHTQGRGVQVQLNPPWFCCAGSFHYLEFPLFCSENSQAQLEWAAWELEQWPEIGLLSSTKSLLFLQLLFLTVQWLLPPLRSFGDLWWQTGDLFMILVLSFRRWEHSLKQTFFILGSWRDLKYRKTVIYNHPDNYLDFSLCKEILYCHLHPRRSSWETEVTELVLALITRFPGSNTAWDRLLK